MPPAELLVAGLLATGLLVAIRRRYSFHSYIAPDTYKSLQREKKKKKKPICIGFVHIRIPRGASIAWVVFSE